MGTVTSVMQDAAADDPHAFVLLLEPVLPAAYRLAFGMLRSGPDAEDAVQESVLKAWRTFSRFRRGEDLKPWLLAIVANQCRSQVRSRWWSVVKLPLRLDGFGQSPATSRAESADLRQALDRLPYDQRVALVLRFYLDLTFEEVGRTLGISTKAAESRTYRALDRMRLSPEVMGDE
jgi:RNA polymerase sigma-70 factor (ECF subfamily)